LERRSGLKFVSCVTMVCLAHALLAADRAILYSTSGTTVNGNQAYYSSVVIDGDNVQTGTAGAQLTSKGALVQLDPATTVRYGARLNLGCGGVTVSGNALPVVANGYVFTPADTHSKMQLLNRRGSLLMSVVSGAVEVKGSKPGHVSAGETETYPGIAECPAPKEPAAAASRTKGVIRAGAGAVTVIGVWIYLETRGHSVSQDRP
jgi:hypothetical protein